ncbi:MAG: glycoside hydrolase family 15 protein [Patescibacteria group bacterium]
MAKAITLGNGSIMVNLDQALQVRDFYFPQVGLENHVGGHYAHRLGVWLDGRLSWTSDPGWLIDLSAETDTLASRWQAVNTSLGLTLSGGELVYNEKNIFLRRVTVRNDFSERRTVKFFFSHQFELYESHVAHTAYYDPRISALIHYRNQRVFLINAQSSGHPFDDYSTGMFASEGREGTHRDAEDGQLAKNPIEHGQVDSVIGLTLDCAPGEEKLIYYWVAVGRSLPEVMELNDYVLSSGAGHLLQTTRDYWRAWVYRQNFSFEGLPAEVIRVFNQSLLIVRAHVDKSGAIIASGDSNVLQRGKDNYCYVWPRDGALTAVALTKAGGHSLAKSFFEFCQRVITNDGYFMHKYSPDGSLGSSWHPWLRDGGLSLPIQEDSTALVIYALWKYYQITKDLEFVEAIYNPLIKKAADFMVIYRDERLGLPKPSYDLWEEKFGVHTFTASAVYAALLGAANFAKVLGKVKSEQIYHKAALEIQEAILKYLFDPATGNFVKSLSFERGELVYDQTIDMSSVYGVYDFGILPVTDPRVTRAVKQTVEALSCARGTGGIARHENDSYCRTADLCAGNPWIVTTMWLAQYYLQTANSVSELEPVKKLLLWAARSASPAGILPEQLDQITGAPVSVAPLVWSQAEFIRTVIRYLEKLERLGVCQACNPVY